MHFTTALTTLALLASTTAAGPLPHRALTLHSRADVSQPFYLVTTTSKVQNTTSSSGLAHVLSLGLLEPAGSSVYYLVDEGPGHASYPQFNMTDGNLIARIALSNGTTETIETVELGADSELAFSAQAQPCGDLSLVDGYLLAVNGTAEKWVLCTEASQSGLDYVSFFSFLFFCLCLLILHPC